MGWKRHMIYQSRGNACPAPPLLSLTIGVNTYGINKYVKSSNLLVMCWIYYAPTNSQS